MSSRFTAPRRLGRSRRHAPTVWGVVGRGPLIGGLAVVLAMSAVACSAEGESAGAERSSSAAGRSPSASVPGPSNQEADDSIAPSPTLSPEATAAGPLGPDDMPDPEVLGQGWAYTVIDGDPHDTGFVGNEASTHERNPIEVAELSVPFGCADRGAAAIVPRFALDATYARGDQQAIAIRMRFASAGEATRFVEARSAALRACVDQPPAYDGRQTVPYVRQVGDVTVSRRTEPAVPGHWGELAVTTDPSDVMLVAVQDISRAEAAALAERLAR